MYCVINDYTCIHIFTIMNSCIDAIEILYENMYMYVGLLMFIIINIYTYVFVESRIVVVGK